MPFYLVPSSHKSGEKLDLIVKASCLQVLVDHFLISRLSKQLDREREILEFPQCKLFKEEPNAFLCLENEGDKTSNFFCGLDEGKERGFDGGIDKSYFPDDGNCPIRNFLDQLSKKPRLFVEITGEYKFVRTSTS